MFDYCLTEMQQKGRIVPVCTWVGKVAGAYARDGFGMRSWQRKPCLARTYGGTIRHTDVERSSARLASDFGYNVCKRGVE